MKEKKTMGIAAFVAIMTVISAVAVVGVASYSDVVAADADEKVYDIYIDLGGELSSYILCEDPIVDYGGPEWVEVTASSSKDALVAACDLKFGEGSLELTSSGYIKTINGMGGNGICYFSDQSFTGEANQWGISYYPVQFIKESDGWVYGGSPIASYDGDSTTFAIVCQPSSMDEEAVDFTFEEDAYAMSWDTYDMYFDGLQERFNYFYKVYGWEYGTPNEPFFPIVEYERYSFYIDLGGTVSGALLGTEADYGDASWETVWALNPKDALTAACDQKFGEGGVTYSESSWGISIATIGGMSANGISMKSEQSSSWDDVYYYPVQYVMEDGEWGQASQSIPGYTGGSTTFALVMEPITFDGEEHTFTDVADEVLYGLLKSVYAWPGYGAFPEPFVSTAGVELDCGSVTTSADFTLSAVVYPEDATNKGIVWSSSDESVAIVDQEGDVTVLSAGTATITAVTVYGFFVDSCDVVVEAKEYSFYIDLGGTVSGALLGTEADYGDASWETVWALNPKDALTAACDQKFGEGGVTYSESSWGISIATIGGMSANGISMKSEQSSSWDDVYYYPVQYVMEDGEWGQASQSIPGYTGGSTTFALVMEPITFDGEEHTFTDVADEVLYGLLKSVYAWPGYGAFPEPFVSTVGMEVPRSVEMNVGEEFAVPIEFIPADCTNKNVTMISEDDSIVTVDENGVMTAVSLGAVNIHIFSVYDPLIEYVCSVAVNGFAVDGVVYTVYDYGDVNVVKATGFEEGATSVVIGNEVQCGDLTFKVESIEFTAFVGSSVESATIMVDVEEYAFAKTPLKVVRLEGEIDVGTGAFSNCKKLANVYVSDSVKSIGDRAFYKCVFTDQNGEQIDPVIENMAGHKFLGKNSNLSMYVPELYSQFKVDGIIYKITSIEAMEVAVKGASDDVEEVDIQENVKYLGFTWKVTKIASKAFYNNDNITWVSVYGADVGTKAFAACDSLEVVILDGVGIVGQYAFANSAIDVLYCDAEVLDVSAFSGCVKLTSVGFTNSLTSVGKNAFYKNLFYVDGVKVDRTAANLAGRVFEGGNGVLNAVLLG